MFYKYIYKKSNKSKNFHDTSSIRCWLYGTIWSSIKSIVFAFVLKCVMEWNKIFWFWDYEDYVCWLEIKFLFAMHKQFNMFVVLIRKTCSLQINYLQIIADYLVYIIIGGGHWSSLYKNCKWTTHEQYNLILFVYANI